MPLQNRVDPFGHLVATPERGTMMGNRGGVLHNDRRQIVRPYKSRQWITCLLEFKGRRRVVMTPRLYTELFFLDEATAFAAGHRPCAECRRADFLRFLSAWPVRAPGQKLLVDTIDRALHPERIDERGRKVIHEELMDVLPDGVFVQLEHIPYLVLGSDLLAWSPCGYGPRLSRPRGLIVPVLTPRSFVACFRAGYRPAVHDTARVLVWQESDVSAPITALHGIHQ